ncbi:MAG: hypothetical protein M3328_12710 [Chloroflexota bacterium]|nr:hypothetical protein [Chloroflexota bacterium]
MSEQTATRAAELAIACNLSEAEQAAREEELARDIFSNCEEVAELADGYAFRFPGNGDWAAKLVEFIGFERKCCPFFTFELVFEPQEGPMWLRVKGPSEVKSLVEQYFVAIVRQAPAA